VRRWPSIAAAAVMAAAVALQSAPVLRADPAGDAAQAATARRLAAVRSDPLLLEAFLREMPKGGDLHNHLSGSIYAENYIRWATEDNLCIVTATLSLAAGPCDLGTGRPPASAILQDSALYSATIDAWSMRNWPADRNGHDHFFTAFAKFNPVTTRTGDMLAEVTSRAADEHVSYLELMLSPDGNVAARIGRDAEFTHDLAQMRARLLAAGFDAVFAQAKQRLDAADERRNELQHCGTPAAEPGCAVTVRYVSQVLRAGPPAQVFSQMLAGFELSMRDPRVAGVNLVQPEDDPVAVRDFGLHMTMLEFLRGVYPLVRVALHAGEIVAGMVPPEVLRFHIRDSITKGHALRIGHGVDVMQEHDPFGLLREMAARKVLVEVALTSNDLILGVRGRRHPLRLYLAYGVPVALSTDDLGVSRSSHTREWVKAVEEQGLDYVTIKRLVRNSLEYAFVDAPTKARLKSDLERAFGEFERRQAAARTPR
jgi:adenosine deaminase